MDTGRKDKFWDIQCQEILSYPRNRRNIRIQGTRNNSSGEVKKKKKKGLFVNTKSQQKG